MQGGLPGSPLKHLHPSDGDVGATPPWAAGAAWPEDCGEPLVSGGSGRRSPLASSRDRSPAERLATGEVGPGAGARASRVISAMGLRGRSGSDVVHSTGRLRLRDHDEGLHAQANAQGGEAPQGLQGFWRPLLLLRPAPSSSWGRPYLPLLG